MAERTSEMTRDRSDELRADIRDRRRRVGHTVDQIGNRVNPRHMVARRTHRIRVRLVDMKDRIMGNENPDYGSQEPAGRMRERLSHAGEMASEGIDEAGDRVSEMPEAIRQRARGNPLAAGLIALGGGLLVGSVLPTSRVERAAVEKVEPAVDRAMDEAKETGRQVAEEMREPADRAAEEVKEETKEAGRRIADETSEAGRRIRDESEG